MLPPPPDLARSMRAWTEQELFWIVQHGIKYTGMPGWIAPERTDEIWAVVAFLRRISQLDATSYSELALGGVSLRSQDGRELATIESNPQAAGACARCHGAEATGPANVMVPRLHGQPVAFLATALREYAQGARRSGIMQPLAVDLSDGDIQRLAAYYAELAPPKHRVVPAEEALLQRGERLVTVGDAANGVPACNACHGRDALPAYPRLAGQSAAYMQGQLQLWRAGHHAATAGGAIMAPIAQRLDDRDITAVTAYLAALPAESLATGRP
jgi:cytochrome c553